MKGCRPLIAEEVEQVAASFSGYNAQRDRTLFVLGVMSGFRISELLSLRIKDVVQNKRVRSEVEVLRRNMKGKHESRQVFMNPQAQEAVLNLIAVLQKRGVWNHNSYLFKSRKGKNSPITRVRAYQILSHAFGLCGMSGKLGTHSMRKTFGNNIYNHMLQLVAEGEPVDAYRETAKALGHKSVASTESYLSFRNEHLRGAVRSFSIGERA
jgi:integrase